MGIEHCVCSVQRERALATEIQEEELAEVLLMSIRVSVGKAAAVAERDAAVNRVWLVNDLQGALGPFRGFL